MKDDYGSEYLAANYEFLAIGCRLISNMYNFTSTAEANSPPSEVLSNTLAGVGTSV